MSAMVVAVVYDDVHDAAGSPEGMGDENTPPS